MMKVYYPLLATGTMTVTSSTTVASFVFPRVARRTLVTLHGNAALTPSFRLRRQNGGKGGAGTGGGIHNVSERPPDPNNFLTAAQQEEQIYRLLEWWQNKSQVLCITGAGVSTESGIPDYRGHGGSYHKGHKPMVHDQFMKSEKNRQRYWGRGMVGWRSFDLMHPAAGHVAISALEELGRIGVGFSDKAEFYEDMEDTMDGVYKYNGQRQLSLITQNVDSLHRRAGSQHLIELHGRTDRLRCMQCGTHRDRNSFQSELDSLNTDWLAQALKQTTQEDMRPDGDAAVQTDNYDAVVIPPCTNCGGFVKPDVVFFGDSVPVNRVKQCQTAVEHSDGLLVVGSSLAVHSAFKHVRAARQQGIPVCILNVGQTRAETEGLDVLKIEAPIGTTLSAVVSHFTSSEERVDSKGLPLN
jgi:NAD-dependent deacetylase sirtuin 4